MLLVVSAINLDILLLRGFSDWRILILVSLLALSSNVLDIRYLFYAQLAPQSLVSTALSSSHPFLLARSLPLWVSSWHGPCTSSGPPACDGTAHSLDRAGTTLLPALPPRRCFITGQSHYRQASIHNCSFACIHMMLFFPGIDWCLFKMSMLGGVFPCSRSCLCPAWLTLAPVSKCAISFLL